MPLTHFFHRMELPSFENNLLLHIFFRVLKTLKTSRRQKSLILLVLYLMIFTVSVLHVHDHEQRDFACQDCLSHVQHSGHFDQGSQIDLDCVLCKFLHTSYLAPHVLTLSVAARGVVTIAMQPTSEVVCRNVMLPNLRAPPALG